MYNPVTEREIAATPDLRGLDHDALSLKLTEAFARIATHRVCPHLAREPQSGGGTSIGELERIANTYEALFLSQCVDPDLATRAGFVAATAYSLLLASQERTTAPRRFLHLDSINPVVSSLLLFAASGYFADAAEIARRYLPDTATLDGASASLVAALKALMDTGNLNEVGLLTPGNDDDEGYEAAASVLYGECFRAIRESHEDLRNASGGGWDRARMILEGVGQHCVYTASVGPDAISAKYVFPGPLQLSRLLLSALHKMHANSVLHVRPPSDCPPEAWSEFLQKVAANHPTLWDQHKQIIDQGFLDAGTSAVLSLPTGAGKTSLAELKIAQHVMSGRKVVFLAPTHALELQVADRLAKLFGRDAARVVAEPVGTDAELPRVTTCTTEACLTMLTLAPERFSDVGLIVLDECHNLHAPDLDSARRPLDAMFCLLEALGTVKDADYLLMSAMISGGAASSLAKWISSVTGRPCLAIADEWKPTRQLRGCVVYDQDDVRALKRRISQSYQSSQTDGPPAALKRSLHIDAHVLYCLRDSWTTSVRDYKLLPACAAGQVTLTAGGKRSQDGRWWLSPNRNKVTAAIAEPYLRKGLKTLIFCSDIRSTVSIANEVALQAGASVDLTPTEEALLEQLVEEAGGVEHLYFTRQAATVHHGLLLPKERELVEKLFLRDSGVDLLAATPTLAQGLNLPAEVAIIAGDDRFNANSDSPGSRQRLEAHELLNAAGRAGRAGHFAQGIVLIVPGRVVGLNESDYRISNRWMELQSQFARSDQCLDVQDPLGLVFAAVTQDDETGPNTRYALTRLYPHREDGDAFASRMRKSLWASHHSAADTETEIRQLGERILALGIPGSGDLTPELLELSRRSGVQVTHLQTLIAHLLVIGPATQSMTVEDWISELASIPQLHQLMKPDTVDEILKLSGDTPVADTLEAIALHWVRGCTLVSIDGLFRKTRHTPPKCERARKAVVRWMPELTYIASVLGGLYSIAFPYSSPPLALGVLPRCLRLGVVSPEMLAFLHLRNYEPIRTRCHREFSEIADQIPTSPEDADFGSVLSRVSRAMRGPQEVS